MVRSTHAKNFIEQDDIYVLTFQFDLKSEKCSYQIRNVQGFDKEALIQNKADLLEFQYANGTIYPFFHQLIKLKGTKELRLVHRNSE